MVRGRKLVQTVTVCSSSLPPPQLQEPLSHSHLGVGVQGLCLLEAYCLLRMLVM